MQIEAFFFKAYEVRTNAYIVPERRSTRESIERVGGQVIEGSRLLIDKTRIDDDGREILSTD